eukprot:scaffold3042_cov313-Prasinococcus_capsulatus_cf.AAC.5
MSIPFLGGVYLVTACTLRQWRAEPDGTARPRGDVDASGLAVPRDGLERRWDLARCRGNPNGPWMGRVVSCALSTRGHETQPPSNGAACGGPFCSKRPPRERSVALKPGGEAGLLFQALLEPNLATSLL